VVASSLAAGEVQHVSYKRLLGSDDAASGSSCFRGHDITNRPRPAPDTGVFHKAGHGLIHEPSRPSQTFTSVSGALSNSNNATQTSLARRLRRVINPTGDRPSPVTLTQLTPPTRRHAPPHPHTLTLSTQSSDTTQPAADPLITRLTRPKQTPICNVIRSVFQLLVITTLPRLRDPTHAP